MWFCRLSFSVDRVFPISSREYNGGRGHSGLGGHIMKFHTVVMSNNLKSPLCESHYVASTPKFARTVGEGGRARSHCKCILPEQVWPGRGRGCLRWDWCNPEVDQRNQGNALEYIFHGKLYIAWLLHFWCFLCWWWCCIIEEKEIQTCDVSEETKGKGIKRQTWLQKSIRWGSGPQRPTVQLLVISEM